MYMQKETKKEKSQLKPGIIHDEELLQGSKVRCFCRGRMDMGLPEHPRQGGTTSPSSTRCPLLLVIT